MKKVLVITYYFPPTGGGGVQRTLKFVKYLPLYGWQPIVLTVKNPDFDYPDESLLADLPENILIRKTSSINLWRYYRNKIYGKESLYEIDNKNKDATSNLPGPFLMIKKKIKAIIDIILFVPDEYNGWFPFAFWEGLKIIQKEHIDLIYATGNPWTSFVVAKCLSAISKIPFVMDFRDPWILSPYNTTKDRKRLKYLISKKIERSCVTKASLVINVNEDITSIFKKYYKNEDKAKFITITQGFDSDDFKGISPKENNKFIISHIGTFYNHRKPDKLLKAVNYIFQSHPELRKKIEIRFVGITGSFAEGSIKNNELIDVVKLVNYCSHKESIAEMCSSNLLVLIQANLKGRKADGVTGKFFEYLPSGRRILVLTSKKNEAVQIIRNTNAGRFVEPDNIELIAESILKYYRDWESGKDKRRIPSNIDIYERKNLTGVLAKSFNNVYEAERKK